MILCDSHAHLNHGDAFDGDREEVLQRAREAGLEWILNVATSPEDAGATLEVARSHPGVLAAVGIHPHEAGRATGQALTRLERLAADPTVVVWGEIGLDYHYMNAPQETQRQAFADQLRLAARLDLPVSVHSREADEDIVSLIRQHAGARRGVIHCFTGDWDMARRCLDQGFYLSFSGILTFRSAETLRQVARQAPEDRILVETDSPYLAPAPRRGGRNEPARVVEVLDVLARERGVDREAMAAATTANFFRFLGQSPDKPSMSRAGA